MSTDKLERALGCARVLADHNGGDVTVLDLRKLGLWTDFFIIATATSSTHMRGLLKHLEDHVASQAMETLRRPKPAEDEEWCLMDLGDYVVHLMSANARSFYELEKLWFEAEALTVAPTGPVKAD